MYKWIEIGAGSDLAKLEKHISPEYAPKEVAEKLERALSNAVKAVLIERKYVDKDYRR